MALDQFGLPELPADLTHTSDWHNSPDMILQGLADWAHQLGLGFALTLVVPGGLLSGVPEPQQAFLRGVAARAREIAEEIGADAVKVVEALAPGHFDGPADTTEAKLKAEAEAAPTGQDEAFAALSNRQMMIRHLHLSDSVWHPPGQQPVPLGHTRVLLSKSSPGPWGVRRRRPILVP